MKPLVLCFCLLSPMLLAAQWTELPPTITASFLNTAVAWDGKVYFTGGPKTQYVNIAAYNDKLEILDLASGAISTAPGSLSAGRTFIASVAHQGKLYFAGGQKWTTPSPGLQVFDAVDIYDVATNAWLPTEHLSIARSACAIAVVDGKIMIAGGYSITNGLIGVSDVVDIYDPEAVGNKWSVDKLSQARGELAAASIGNTAWFCGGSTDYYSYPKSARVDVYSVGKGWYTTELSVARAYPNVVAVGQYLICAGGDAQGQGYSNQVDLFDTEANSGVGAWSTQTLPAKRYAMATATLCNKAYFTGGGHLTPGSYFDQSFDDVYVFNADKGTWDTPGKLTKSRMAHACAAWGDNIAVGGGWRAAQAMTTGSVEVLAVADCTVDVKAPTPQPVDFLLSPNPASEQLSLVFPDNGLVSGPLQLSVADVSGRVLLRQTLEPDALARPVSIDVRSLLPGTYVVTLWDERRAGTRRFVVLR
ncbi:MAG: hypothetical protein IT260_09765 [Saprospiraceae bacterium]|nr:hypothetical protein [Saprospiraceae bacterium]